MKKKKRKRSKLFFVPHSLSANWKSTGSARNAAGRPHIKETDHAESGRLCAVARGSGVGLAVRVKGVRERKTEEYYNPLATVSREKKKMKNRGRERERESGVAWGALQTAGRSASARARCAAVWSQRHQGSVRCGVANAPPVLRAGGIPARATGMPPADGGATRERGDDVPLGGDAVPTTTTAAALLS